MKIKVGARSSPLSRAQVEEIASFYPQLAFDPIFVKTRGDLDQTTSLRSLGKTDFFTRELDQMLLAGDIQLAIHSAKDLPEPLPLGLVLVAITKGVDPRDSLVLREGESIDSLSPGALIATSSLRRESMVKQLRSDLRFTDIRGAIEERLAKIYQKEVDGVVVAEAALIRLKLTHLNRIYLPGETVEGQGKLAIVARAGDEQVRSLFAKIHFISRP